MTKFVYKTKQKQQENSFLAYWRDGVDVERGIAKIM
jgi:hypothetical protein